MQKIRNWINGRESNPVDDTWLEKYNPHTGELLSMYANSGFDDIDQAIVAASAAFESWSSLPAVRRGEILFNFVHNIISKKDELAACVAIETGKKIKDALGEVNGSVLQGQFFAGEGMRMYGRTLTSAVPQKQSFTIRHPHGVVGLIVPANTPIANIAWKIFPALICGNTAVLKASEDAPEIAFLLAKIATESGLPDGVFNVIQGTGVNAGRHLVHDHRVPMLSFTGSSLAGKWIAETAGSRLARVSLELGGKNPLVVCSDADLANAVHWAILSAFSNAGQRCSAGSRILVFENIYEEFTAEFVAKTRKLVLGTHPESDLGPVINRKQLEQILNRLENLPSYAKVTRGGQIDPEQVPSKGYYIEPIIIEGLDYQDRVCQEEIFGPVVTLLKVKDINEAIEVANSTSFGLTSAIHTRDINKAMLFTQKVRSGVANVNIGTFGSEPHMPFGGFGMSGNGWREPGVEALDAYTELKNISLNWKIE